jgi:predicted RNA binding protein YcfA (HicA-like mRNA interferase family)
MAKKIRELKAMLRKAGFSSRPGKGNHSVWSHPRLSGRNVTVSGNDGNDAPEYLEKKVRHAIREAEQDS